MNILEVLEDTNLFAQWFQGESWNGWKSFLSALFGLEMNERQLALFREHTQRQNAPAKPFREAWVVAGRRGGKSLVASAVAVYLAACTITGNCCHPARSGWS
jgi:hypothetical protein